MYTVQDIFWWFILGENVSLNKDKKYFSLTLALSLYLFLSLSFSLSLSLTFSLSFPLTLYSLNHLLSLHPALLSLSLSTFSSVPIFPLSLSLHSLYPLTSLLSLSFLSLISLSFLSLALRSFSYKTEA